MWVLVAHDYFIREKLKVLDDLPNLYLSYRFRVGLSVSEA